MIVGPGWGSCSFRMDIPLIMVFSLDTALLSVEEKQELEGTSGDYYWRQIQSVPAREEYLC